MDDGFINIWLVFRFFSKFWLSWKSSSGEDTLFLKGFYFCINFTNFLKNICADQVVLKIRALNQEKNSWSALVKISDQEFKSWSTKYLKLKIKNKSWYIHDFFEPVSNNASSTSPFNVVIGYFDIFFNNCPRFSQRCFFNSNFQVAHMRSFHQIFFLC